MNSSGENVIILNWFNRHRRRIAEIGIGHAIYASFNFFFDQILYVYVVYRLGLFVGGSIMTALSLVQCAITLIIYERMGIDWVGVGSLSRLSNIPHPSWWQRIIIAATGMGAPQFF